MPDDLQTSVPLWDMSVSQHAPTRPRSGQVAYNTWFHIIRESPLHGGCANGRDTELTPVTGRKIRQPSESSLSVDKCHINAVIVDVSTGIIRVHLAVCTHG